jgi:hypothetical protein
MRTMRTLFGAFAALFLLAHVATAQCISTSPNLPNGGWLLQGQAVCTPTANGDLPSNFLTVDPASGNLYDMAIPSALQCDPTSSSCGAVPVWGYAGGPSSFLYMPPSGGSLMFYGQAWVLYGQWGNTLNSHLQQSAGHPLVQLLDANNNPVGTIVP